MDLRVVCAILVCASAFGCSPDMAKQFEYGEAVPDARLEIYLPDSLERFELLRRFERLANRNGFDIYRGKTISPELVNEPNYPRYYYWYTPESSDLNPYSVGFSWDRTAEEEVNQFRFVFGKGALGSFTERDWLFFRHWKDEVLPSEFSGARIEISRHPADNTDPDELQRIADRTGMSVPERP